MSVVLALAMGNGHKSHWSSTLAMRRKREFDLGESLPVGNGHIHLMRCPRWGKQEQT